MELKEFFQQQEKEDEYNHIREIMNSLSRKNKRLRLSTIDSSDKAYINRLILLDSTLFCRKKNKVNRYITDYMDLCVSETDTKPRSLVDILAEMVFMGGENESRQSKEIEDRS